MALSATVPGPVCVTAPLPLMTLLKVTALGSVNWSVPLSVTAPLPRPPTVVPPSASVPAVMVVPPE